MSEKELRQHFYRQQDIVKLSRKANSGHLGLIGDARAASEFPIARPPRAWLYNASPEPPLSEVSAAELETAANGGCAVGSPLTTEQMRRLTVRQPLEPRPMTGAPKKLELPGDQRLFGSS